MLRGTHYRNAFPRMIVLFSQTQNLSMQELPITLNYHSENCCFYRNPRTTEIADILPSFSMDLKDVLFYGSSRECVGAVSVCMRVAFAEQTCPKGAIFNRANLP